MLPVITLAILNYFFQINIVLLLLGFSIYFFIDGIRYGIKTNTLYSQLNVLYYYDENNNLREYSILEKIKYSLKFFIDLLLKPCFQDLILFGSFLPLSYTCLKIFSLKVLVINFLFFLTSIFHNLGMSFYWVFKK